ncbi:dihydrodipicolinate synthase family protein [Vineibacter terrae]|uniref:Dihydrodipicolinate synthase family protein n=1 Tax=Vineibacter terrae TaxID=2586908 RepID=A0A5C8PS70_9HYPH|nr:dihydrodipicolinate synthase family protein [Vineibacter terrae]TXL79504.1 dihydrodipicolinate synthase family protein [Vineibacter terrae]
MAANGGLHWSDIPAPVLAVLRQGAVLPAHPLALDENRAFDRDSQRALSRYYIDAGSGGLAVGVHATQFQIRDVGLYRPVLELAQQTADAWTDRPLVMIAGVIGKTAQAVEEARLARALGYHAVLLGLGALKGAGEDELVAHCAAVAREMPLVGFYLQTAVGGIPLSRAFWARFAAIENVIAIKVAPFNRYKTLDVAVGVAMAGAEDRVTLYTGNDDHIVADLLMPWRVRAGNREVTLRFRGGLLGHWSVWTKAAVGLLGQAHAAVDSGSVPLDVLALDSKVTDCNAVVFDVANEFRGCIPGCHEILRRQGLLRTVHCLDPHEVLSPGQSDEIDRLYATYPELTDDAFVAANLARWRG